jgi:hypothetical protein
MFLYFAITFMQAIYSCTPEASHVSRVYNVAPVLWLQIVTRYVTSQAARFVLLN